MAFDEIRLAGLILFLPLYWLISAQVFKKARAWRYEFEYRNKPIQPYIFEQVFISLAVIIVSLALAGPKAQYEKTVFNYGGIELAIGIDVSKSMLAEDVDLPGEDEHLFPIHNRLNRARYFAMHFLSGLRGERAGAFIFSGNGVEAIPFTSDYGYGRYVLRHINPADITLPGSDLGAAIQTGIAMLETAGTSTIKRMILLSDGEDISPDTSTIYESAKQAAHHGIRIYTVGIGMGKGVLIPMRNQKGEIEDYYTAEDGSNLKTRLEQDPLKMIAMLTGGTYIRDSNSAYRELLELILREAEGYAETQTIEKAWLDLSPFLLIAAFCFFAVAIGGSPLLEKHYRHMS